MKLLGGFDQNVYECKAKGNNFILKILSGTKYDISSVKQELAWMNYLADHGLNISLPVRSVKGKIIEEMKWESEYYIVVAFEKAHGSVLADLHLADLLTVKKWGEAMGRMHHVAKLYPTSRNSLVINKEWNNNSIFTEYPPIENKVLDKWQTYIAELQLLDKDINSYGTIHNDFHHHNFHVHAGEIILFDFGDIEKNWFAYDIAISLYHAVKTIPSSEQIRRRDFTLRFYDTFMSGYTNENLLDKYWLAKIPYFLDYRQIYSYVYTSKYMNIDHSNEKVNKVLKRMKYNIEHDIPFIDFNLHIG
ncbi:phosphotransferase enzyme family protein [Bacillus sp. SCS-151]|uniref:phosphotransferase enzyme family protein n=1 Tax=Nanhaiella sioensis TaxID=3115293 RepID=UPI00397B0D7E